MGPGDRVLVRRMGSSELGTISSARGGGFRVDLDSGRSRTISAGRLALAQAPRTAAPEVVTAFVQRGPPSAPMVRPFRPMPKDTATRSADHLRLVRAIPCCVCGKYAPSEAHHHEPGSGTMGGKCSDHRTSPLCDRDHRHWHDHGHFEGMTRDQSVAVQLRAQRAAMVLALSGLDDSDAVKALDAGLSILLEKSS